MFSMQHASISIHCLFRFFGYGWYDLVWFVLSLICWFSLPLQNSKRGRLLGCFLSIIGLFITLKTWISCLCKMFSGMVIVTWGWLLRCWFLQWIFVGVLPCPLWHVIHKLWHNCLGHCYVKQKIREIFFPYLIAWFLDFTICCIFPYRND